MRVKFLGIMVLATLLGFGCSTAKVQVSSKVQTDSPEADGYHPGGGDKILGNLAEWLVKERGVEADEFELEPENTITPVTRYRAEELVGTVWVSLPEPELSEVSLRENRCAESASAWCAPDVEDEYLAYLEQEEKPKFGISIFPNFVSPVDDGLVLRGMRVPAKGKRGHYGLDIIPAAPERQGTCIKAVEDGIVVESGRAKGYGYYTVVYHQNGLFSLYSHLSKNTQVVKVGQNVQRGDKIALMGKSGNARGYHLHFELIDLRENWGFQKGIDEFIADLCGRDVKKLEFNQLSKLLFNKQSKRDPLPNIPGLALAKRVNGKWVDSLVTQVKSLSQAAKAKSTLKSRYRFDNNQPGGEK